MRNAEIPDPAGRDSNSFESVYRAFAPALVGYLAAHGIDDPEAVTHDVFLAVLPRIGTIRGGESGVRTLLFSIAHARCVDHHRRRARRPRIVEYEPALDFRMTESAEEMATARDSPVLSLLSALSEDQREVLLLRVIADLSLEHVAGIMEKSVGAIKQLQRRALLTLKAHPELENWGSQ
jgi:RNA polymerase sigma-70 factor (ECF subfamily)